MNTEAPIKPAVTAKQELFCLGLLAGQGQSDAYRLAYKPSSKIKPKVIHERACRLAKNRKVVSRLAEMRAPVIRKAQMSRERWLEHIESIIECDVRKMFDSHGNPIEIADLPKNEASAIAGFEFCEEFGSATKGKQGSDSGELGGRIPIGYTKKFKLLNRLRALELYGKAQCFYADKMVLTGPDGQPLEITNNITVEFIEAPKR
ncbi:MAG: hypothetical protein HY348_09045 [Nitrospira defluvii]|nr:hypothetical protein [Nitrospira defluvii]